MPENWKKMEFIQWGILPGVLWDVLGIFIMRICCFDCLGSMRNFSLIMHGDMSHVHCRYKAYKPQDKSIGSGQVLHCPCDFNQAKLVLKEMADMLAMDLVDKGL